MVLFGYGASHLETTKEILVLYVATVSWVTWLGNYSRLMTIAKEHGTFDNDQRLERLGAKSVFCLVIDQFLSALAEMHIVVDSMDRRCLCNPEIGVADGDTSH